MLASWFPSGTSHEENLVAGTTIVDETHGIYNLAWDRFGTAWGRQIVSNE